MRLSMMPSPNRPASTVSVTTKDTLRKTDFKNHKDFTSFASILQLMMIAAVLAE